MPGKIFISPIAAAFLSPYEHLAHKKFPAGVTCSSLCPGFGTKLRTQPEFSLSENFPTPPTYAALWLGLWAAQGKAGMGTGSWHVLRTHQSCQAMGQVWEGCSPSTCPHSYLAPQGYWSRAAPALITLITIWFHTATRSLSCFLLRQETQTEKH